MPSPKKKSTSQFTAQNVDVKSIDLFNSIKAETVDTNTKKQITTPRMVEMMIAYYANADNKTDIETKLHSENEALKAEIEVLKDKIQNPEVKFYKSLDRFREHDIITDEDVIKFIISKLEFTELENTNLRIELEEAKKNNFVLKDKQFICEFADEVSILAKKCRVAIQKDGYIKDTLTGDYPNKLANLCVKNFLLQNYEEITKK